MPFANHSGQRIHYTVDGAGPLVVLQHGLFQNAECWRDNGLVAALADRFRVACVNSLGHGLSDKPSDPALYGQAQRAGDIVAVIDDLGDARAHLIGYSMGGWLSVGVAKFYPERLSSLTVGGWDLVSGIPDGPAGPIQFDAFLAYARATAPALAGWVTPEIEPAIRACFEALSELDGAAEAVLGAGCPVLLWDGQADGYHAPMQAFAAANALQFLSNPGDHIAAVQNPGAETLKRIQAFLDGA